MARTPWPLVASFAAVYLFWGGTYLAIRYGVETLPPFLMAGARHLIAGVVLYAWARRSSPSPSRLHWRSALVVGVLLLLGGNGGVTWAEQTVPSGLTALLVATVPLWMTLFHWAGAGRREAHWTTALGIALGLVGVGLLVDPSSGAGGSLAGAVVVVGAAVSWAAGSLYARRATLPGSPVLATGMELLAGGAALVLVGLGAGEAQRFDPGAVTARSWLAFVYLVVFGSVVAFTAYVYMLQHATPAKVSTYAYVNPAVAVLLGWGFANEPFTPRMALAGAVILAAVILITGRRPRPAPPAHKAPEASAWTTTTSGST